MPVTVKVMSPEDAADDDSRKSHRLFTDIREVHFSRKADGTPWLTLRRSNFHAEVDDATSFEPQGNIYVMNDAGRTVSTFGVAPLDPAPFTDTIFIDGRPVTDLRLGGPVSVSLLRELVQVPAPRHLIRVGENGYDLIPHAAEASMIVQNGDRFLTDLSAA